MATRKTRLVIAFVLMLSLVSFFSIPASAITTLKVDGGTVTYNMGGGDPSTFYASGASITIAPFGIVPNGKTFSGWILNGNDTDLGRNEGYLYQPGEQYTMPDNNLNFKANFSDAASFVVTYYGNGNTDGVPPEDTQNPYIAGLDVKVLDKNTLARTGFEFTGWDTDDNGTVTYQPNQKFTMPSNNVDLYAQWTPINYTVTYQPGAHGNFGIQTTSGLAFGVATPTPPATTTNDEYWYFNGWDPIPGPTVTGNADYVAQWTYDGPTQTYSVTYDPGEHGDFDSVTTTGLALGADTPTPPAHPGDQYWYFTTWSPVPTATVTGNAVYVAQWTYDGPMYASISLDKSVSPADVSSRSTDVVYTFVVTNTGDYPLYNVSITDPALNVLIEFDGMLDSTNPDSTFTTTRAFSLSNLGTAPYGNWDGDTFINTATVTAYNYELKANLSTEYRGEMVSATDSAIVTYSSYTPPPRRDRPDPPPVVIPEPEVPAAVVPVLDEPIPAAPLPKTGGLDPSFLYGLGALLAGSGLVIKRKKK